MEFEAAAPSDAFTAGVTTSLPEQKFAERASPPPLERPRPARRRAIFIDVENTSRPSRIVQALSDLAIDHADATTDLVASGNWRVIGSETARLLAQKGAQLVHSAPATGVRDWSDLRIAVSAGVWLASARPGDRLQIVSDDRAFDAVGDVAATLGVEFTRLSYRKAEAMAKAAGTAAAGAAPAARGTRRRRGATRPAAAASRSAAAAAPAGERAVEAPEPVAPASSTAPQSAPEAEVLDVTRELLRQSPGGVSLDAIANRLKALGFQRPPNSPRLVTRLRSFKELDVSPRGRVTLATGETDNTPSQPDATGEAPAASGEGARRSGRRRGSRGGRKRGSGGNAGATPPEV